MPCKREYVYRAAFTKVIRSNKDSCSVLWLLTPEGDPLHSCIPYQENTELYFGFKAGFFRIQSQYLHLLFRKYMCLTSSISSSIKYFPSTWAYFMETHCRAFFHNTFYWDGTVSLRFIINSFTFINQYFFDSCDMFSIQQVLLARQKVDKNWFCLQFCLLHSFYWNLRDPGCHILILVKHAISRLKCQDDSGQSSRQAAPHHGQLCERSSIAGFSFQMETEEYVCQQAIW